MISATIHKGRNLLYKSKDWVEGFAYKPGALWALFWISFAESSFFPIPPDVLLIAIAAMNPKKAFHAAAVCALGSVLGGVAGYGIGYALMEGVGSRIVNFYNAQAAWDTIVNAYRSEIGIWFLAGAAFTPIPYKVATIAAGATQMDLPMFVLVSALGRAGRFFLVASLFYFMGARIKEWIDRYLEWLTVAFLILFVAGFAAIKLLA